MVNIVVAVLNRKNRFFAVAVGNAALRSATCYAVALPGQAGNGFDSFDAAADWARANFTLARAQQFAATTQAVRSAKRLSDAADWAPVRKLKDGGR